MSVAPESPWHHQICVFYKHQKNPLPSIAEGLYTAVTNTTCTNCYMHYGEKEFSPQPVSTTRCMHLSALCTTSCDSHRFLPDNDGLTGKPYQPVLTIFNVTHNFRPGPPPWPLPATLLQKSQTLSMYLSYYLHSRPPQSSTYNQACIRRPTCNIYQYFNRCKPVITQTSTDKNLLRPP